MAKTADGAKVNQIIRDTLLLAATQISDYSNKYLVYFWLCQTITGLLSLHEIQDKLYGVSCSKQT